jgi:hypothetical protein
MFKKLAHEQTGIRKLASEIMNTEGMQGLASDNYNGVHCSLDVYRFDTRARNHAPGIRTPSSNLS